jgi:3-hydroxyisobutyrate dehydrogenase
MARVAFIGLGNMGGPMAANLAKAGHTVKAFDLSPDARARAASAGCLSASSISEAVRDAETVVTMLPAGAHCRSAYEDIRTNTPGDAMLIDCSTIDVPTAKDLIAEATGKGLDMVDAPVSGGVAAATAGTLTFMVGGTGHAFERAKPFLEAMGKAVIHAGDAGTGQAAKICNNMLLGISMIGTCEAFALAEKLGLDPARFFEISSRSSGQCWSMTSYCPVPGPVPASPANREYQPGFATAMMLKDLRLADEASSGIGAQTPLGHHARELYEAFSNQGGGDLDFSAIIQMLSASKKGR